MTLAEHKKQAQNYIDELYKNWESDLPIKLKITNHLFILGEFYGLLWSYNIAEQPDEWYELATFDVDRLTAIQTQVNVYLEENFYRR